MQLISKRGIVLECAIKRRGGGKGVTGEVEKAQGGGRGGLLNSKRLVGQPGGPAD